MNERFLSIGVPSGLDVRSLSSGAVLLRQGNVHWTTASFVRLMKAVRHRRSAEAVMVGS